MHALALTLTTVEFAHTLINTILLFFIYLLTQRNVYELPICNNSAFLRSFFIGRYGAGKRKAKEAVIIFGELAPTARLPGASKS